MATTYKSPTIGQITISATKTGEVVANSGSVDFGAASTSYVAGDLAICVNLPAYHIPLDIIGDIQDADSGTTHDRPGWRHLPGNREECLPYRRR